MVNTGATRTNASLQSSIPEPEFLPYEPLDEDFLTTSPAPVVEDQETAWDNGELCTDNTAVVPGGMCDPFTSLWDRNAYGVAQEYAGYDDADTGVTEGTLGKRSTRGGATYADYDEWNMEDDMMEQPVKKKRNAAMSMGDMYDKDDSKSHAHSRNLCPRATRILKEWMTSPEHFDHPYPDEKEKLELAAKAGITTKQLTIWFTNARKRIWVPMRKRQVRCACVHSCCGVCARTRNPWYRSVCAGLADHRLRGVPHGAEASYGGGAAARLGQGHRPHAGPAPHRGGRWTPQGAASVAANRRGRGQCEAAAGP